MKNKIPQGPWNNPPITDGIYDATIDHLRTRYYNDNKDDVYVQIVFRLTDLNDRYFVSNIYFPHGKSQRSEQRLYRLCELVGLEKQEVKEQPHLFQKKRLQLRIGRMERPDVNNGIAYYDVDLFLPANPENTGDEKDETKKPQVKKQAKLKFD